MRIFVLGNINAGKTFTAKKLKVKFPSYEVLSIDEYRKNLSDGTYEGEEKTVSAFIRDIKENSNAIIEYSGGKNITDRFIDSIDKNSFVILEVTEDIEECISRLKDKNLSLTPYPKVTEKIEDTIIRLDSEFKNNAVYNNFKNKYLKKFVVNSNIDLETLNLNHYELAIKLAQILYRKTDYLISYGSLARGELNKFSDLDLYLVTNRSKEEILDLIKNKIKCKKIIIQKNLICLYTTKEFNEILVELTIVDQLDKIKPFYSTGRIIEVDKSLLFGNNEVLDTLEEYKVDKQYNFEEDFDAIVAKLDYYTESLLKMHKKSDIYKYYFHSNIVLHEYIKLSYFLNGGRNANYSPSNAVDIIGLELIKAIKYDFKVNTMDHYHTVRALVNELISASKIYKESKDFKDSSNLEKQVD